jgi:hypothetical protein
MWQFHDSVPADRQERLLACNAFADIVALILLNARIMDALWEQSRRQDLLTAGCRRAAFRIEVRPWLYDAFFNSPAGYRAQYARSAALGIQQNRDCLTTLAPRLIQFAGELPLPELLALTRSLDGPGAKIWINEEELIGQVDGPPEIDYQPWREMVAARADGITAGLRAPVGRELVVYGEWIDRTGTLYLDPYKLGRAQEIHDVGWT